MVQDGAGYAVWCRRGCHHGASTAEGGPRDAPWSTLSLVQIGGVHQCAGAPWCTVVSPAPLHPPSQGQGEARTGLAGHIALRHIAPTQACLRMFKPKFYLSQKKITLAALGLLWTFSMSGNGQ